MPHSGGNLIPFVQEDQLLSQDNVVAITSPRFWNEALQHATNQATLLSEEAQLRVLRLRMSSARVEEL